VRRGDWGTTITWFFIIVFCIAAMFGVVVLVQNMLEGR
jgi:cytochrome c biogenesis protein ResB